jgi:hypothetical protein
MEHSGQKKMTKKQAEDFLYNMWENNEVPSNFTEDHSDYSCAVKQLMNLGYLIKSDFFDEEY